MANKYKLIDLHNCLDSIQDVSNTFGRMAKMLEESDEVQDKEECLTAADRITVGLSELRQMLQEDIMIEELT